jgi:regulatory protein
VTRQNGGTVRPGPGRPVPSELSLEEQIPKAREAALRLLSVRERSQAELRQRLRKKGYSAEAVTRVLDRLVETGLQDDARFATLYADTARSRGYASRRVAQDLRVKGVETTVSIEASTVSPEAEAEQARAVAARRLGSLARYPAEVRARRLSAFLQRRGYDRDVIQEIVQDITDDDD